MVFFFLSFFINPACAPTQCNTCDRRNTTTCYGFQENQLCATNRDSLGTTHCGSIAIKYLEFPLTNVVKDGFYRGCIDCAGKCSPDQELKSGTG